MICTAANALWLAGCLRESSRFRRATACVRVEQHRILERLIRANADTDFGRRHGFSAIRSVRDYQTCVPARTYEEYRAYVERVTDGAVNVLTRERVRLFEPTSGSASATKLIPYTTSLQHEFQKGIQSWIADLFLHHPNLMRGQAYWSVSPALVSRGHTAGGIPIGFDDDAAYVGGWRKRLVQAVMAAPASLRSASDLETFQHLTLLSLVRSSSLRIVSVWNPTFLSLLVGQLQSRADALLHDLDGRRRDVLRTALRARTAAERHAILWPNLRLISCWADGNARTPATELASLFPQAHVQPKGLIATEGFVSFPLTDHDGSILAIRSHFFEFSPADLCDDTSDPPPILPHELERGRRYELIVTNGGGLYRYRLGDVIEVVGQVNDCPLIKFAGRGAYVSDWFGEKLSEAHVARVLQQALQSAGVRASFAMVACDPTLTPPAYVCYIDANDSVAALDALGTIVESGLRKNFHYNYARLLGQLGPLRVFRAQGAAATYLSTAVHTGQRAGDVKPLALDRRDGWSRRFRGQFVANRPASSTASASIT